MERTADWHRRFRAAAAVYGHLHIPLTLAIDGVRFDEVSLGYPREWKSRAEQPPYPVRRIIPPDPDRRPIDHRLLKAFGRAKRKSTLAGTPTDAVAEAAAELRRGRERMSRMLR
jgi:hypothetical protein